jgi:hypothetical protein
MIWAKAHSGQMVSSTPLMNQATGLLNKARRLTSCLVNAKKWHLTQCRFVAEVKEFGFPNRKVV